MTDLVSKILADRALVRAFDDEQLKIIEGVLKAHLPAGQAMPTTPQPCAEIIAQPISQPAISQPVRPDRMVVPALSVAEQPDNRYVAYVDGACSGNPGPGGWAAYFPASGDELCGMADQTTNNQMEIVAAAVAVRSVPAGAFIEVFTDSQLVVETMAGRFKRKSNIDLWSILDEACKRRTVTFTWVKGHNGQPAQERANELAQREAQRRKQQLAVSAA